MSCSGGRNIKHRLSRNTQFRLVPMGATEKTIKLIPAKLWNESGDPSLPFLFQNKNSNMRNKDHSDASPQLPAPSLAIDLSKSFRRAHLSVVLISTSYFVYFVSLACYFCYFCHLIPHEIKSINQFFQSLKNVPLATFYSISTILG